MQREFEQLFNNVSRETFEKLEKYVSLLMKWNKSINLVAACSEQELWQRHIFDSMELVMHIEKQKNIIDIGSGGGLPAIIVAICCEPRSIRLIESDKRKAIFLQEAIRELCLANTQISTDRCEKIAPLGAEIITARACAPLVTFFEIAAHHLGADAKMMLLKGKKAPQEIMQAKAKNWLFDCNLYDNKFSDGFVVEIKNLRRA